MKKFPVLYKKTATGAIQFWEIEVVGHQFYESPAPGVQVPDGPEAGIIITRYGQLGTDSPQVTQDTIEEGKNLGKANETTPCQQACNEAQAKWEKQKKRKGYVETKEAAEAGEVDAVIEGGIFPMLADKFSTKGDRVQYMAYLQPKLDGYRCIAIVRNGKCTLWSRTRKRINSCPHIEEAVEKLAGGQDCIFDGELYNHEWVKQYGKEKAFEMLGIARKKQPTPGVEDVCYHIYDMPEAPLGMGLPALYHERLQVLKKLFLFAIDLVDSPLKYLVEVETIEVQDEDEAVNAFEHYLDQKYEGAILRTRDGLYFGHPTKRSLDLLKIKEFDDAEFEVLNVEQGRGKMAGKAVFVCRAQNGQEFGAKKKGKLEALREYWENPQKYIGQQLTVQYQGLTSKKKVPRFPVALRFREEE